MSSAVSITTLGTGAGAGEGLVKLKNVFGQTWKKEKWVLNVKPASGALLSASDKFLAVPWAAQGGDGRLCVFPIGTEGKLPDVPQTIQAHRDAIVDVSWSPFSDPSVVATCSRGDPSAKLWRIAAEGALPRSPLAALAHTATRVVSVSFHPHVAGVAMTAATDGCVRLWDLAAGPAERHCTDAHPDAVLSAAIDEEEGGLVLTSCKDLCCRVLDPRAGKAPVSSTRCAEVAKGFTSKWVEEKGLVLTAGFSKGSATRVISLRDRRALSKVVASVAVDSLPYPIAPYYDWTTGLLMLFSRGNVTSCFEIHSISPYLIPVGRTVSQTNHSGMCVAPKRVVDPLRFEVARAFALTVCNTIEPVSFIVPRREDPGAALFHEDLFRPVPSGEPSTESSVWFGPDPVLTKPALRSLRPEGVKSIFEVDAAQGGKSREQEELRLATVTTAVSALGEAEVPPISEGRLGMACAGEAGGPPTVKRRYVSLTSNRVYVFEDDEAPTSIVWFDAVDIAAVVGADEDGGPPLQFTVLADGNLFTFEAEDEATKRSWVRSIQTISSAAKKAPPVSGSPAPAKSLLVYSPKPRRGSFSVSPSSTSPVPSPTGTRSRSPVPENVEPVIESVLHELAHTETGEVVVKKCRFSLVNAVLYRYELAADGTTVAGLPTEVAHLDRILKVAETEGIFDPSVAKGFSFKVCTPALVVHLLADSEASRLSWVGRLSRMRRQVRLSGSFSVPMAGAAAASPGQRAITPESDATSDGEEDDEGDEEAVLEGDIELLREGRWTKAYGTAVDNELFFFEQKASRTPFMRVPLSSVDSVSAVDNSDPAFASTDFEVAVSGGAVIQMLRAASGEQRARWVQGLEEKRKKAVDVLSKLGIVEATFRSDPALNEKDGKVVKIADVIGGDHAMLLGVVGKRRIRVCNVEVSAKSLNPNNSFLLDAGGSLYLWHGRRSSRITRGKAADLAHRVRVKERSARPTLVMIVQGTQDETDATAEGFWKAIGGRLTDAEAMSTPRFPTTTEQDAQESPVTVYRVGPRSAKQRAKRVTIVHEWSVDRGLPSRSLLRRRNVYVVDAATEIYVWLGKLSDEEQRELGMLVARKLLGVETAGVGRPAWAHVYRVPQDAELSAFKEKFTGMVPVHSYAPDAPSNVAGARAQRSTAEIASAMAQQPAATLDVTPPEIEECDDGAAPNGTVRIFKVEESTKTEYPPELTGSFFSADSFVVVYSYRPTAKKVEYEADFVSGAAGPAGKTAHVIYFWQGRDSRSRDKGTSAFITREQAMQLGAEKSTQIRVVQGKEPRHFRAIFSAACGRTMIVHKGRHSAFDPTKPALFEVRSQDGFVTAVEATLSSTNLNSFHAFVLTTSAGATTWIGSHSALDEREGAARVAAAMSGKSASGSQVEEGNEPDEFWAALGGRHAHFAGTMAHNPRLFIVSQASGAVEVEEEASPNQDDLVENATAIVDGSSAIFVWTSTKTAALERRAAMEIALEFASRTSRPASAASVLVVQAWHEPLEFRALFCAWSPNRHGIRPKGETDEERPARPVAEVLAEQQAARRTFTLAELTAAGKGNFPQGVDPKSPEDFLSDDAFVQAFKMTREEWSHLKKWQQEDLKKSCGLF